MWFRSRRIRKYLEGTTIEIEPRKNTEAKTIEERTLEELKEANQLAQQNKRNKKFDIFIVVLGAILSAALGTIGVLLVKYLTGH